MPKNLELFDALDSRGFAARPVEERIKALDAILQSKPSDPRAFRQAIADNKTFWSAVNASFISAPDPHLGTKLKNLVLEPTNHLETNEFLDPTHATHNFSKIYQKAAEQRVSLGLMQVNNEILARILVNNIAEVRAYLASKDPQIITAFGDLTKTEGWGANQPVAAPAPGAPAAPPPAPLNNSNTVLTDEAVARIRQQALDRLLIKTIEGESSTLELLRAFHGATSTPAFAAAARALRLPPTAVALLTLPAQLSASVQEVLNNKIQKYEQDNAQKAFITHVNGLSTTQLVGEEVIRVLNANTADVFKNALPAPLKAHFRDADMPWAQGMLGLRFLQTVLPRQGSPRLIDALKATDNAVFLTELRAIMGGSTADYLTHTATPENQGAIKKAILQSLIAESENSDLLKQLSSAKDVTQFKEVIKTIGVVPNDWIANQYLADLKQSVRSRQLELSLAVHSKFKRSSHPELLKLFASLPVPKQIDILNKPNELVYVLSASANNLFTHYWGVEAVQCAAVVEENKRLKQFAKLHNSTVARILASSLSISLNEAQVKAINRLLHSPSPQFINPAYSRWIAQIKAQCPGADEHFNQLFGLKADGSFIDPPDATTSIPYLIKKQCQANEDLEEALDTNPNPGQQKLLGIFLGLAKTESDDVAVADLENNFKSAHSLANFLEHYNGFTQTFKSQLATELTAERFMEIKRDINQEAFALNNQTAAIKALRDNLKPMKERLKIIQKNGYALSFINGISAPVHLYNPAVQGKAKAQAQVMREHYAGIAADTDLIINELTRNARQLQSEIETLPTDNINNTDAIKKLRQELEEELTRTDSILSFYQGIGEKLKGPNGILKAVDDAANGKQYYVYSTNVTFSTCSPADLGPLLNGGAGAVDDNRLNVQVGGPRQIQNFVLGEIPPGQVGKFDVQVGALYGRFTEQHDLSTAKVSTNSKGEVTKAATGRFELKQFPTHNPPLNPNTPNYHDLLQEQKKARIDFSLVMAVQILASMDGPPTKENPLILTSENEEAVGHLWTALMILGQKNPEMKFGPEAIVVNSSTFSPQSQYHKNFLGTVKFNDQSYYNNFVDNAQASVDQKTSHLAEVTSTKFNPQTAKERTVVDSKAVAATKLSKSKLHDVLEHAKTKINEEGPTPPPRDRSNRP